MRVNSPLPLNTLIHDDAAGDVLLDVRGLRACFHTREGVVKAVDGLSLQLRAGEILGLVGESGSGKSVTGFALMRLLDDSCHVQADRLHFNGHDLQALSGEQYRQLRGRDLAMIFQDPMMTLNPVLTIGTQMIEAVLAHQRVTRKVARQRSVRMLAKVGITSPAERLRAYPHHLSGGMRQRVAIAIALLNSPKLIIADEPTTALDVTIQGQILYEVQKLCQEMGTALIWITHDLAVVSGLADRLAVMYAGRLVEVAPAAVVVGQPQHPYTHGLIASIPSMHTRGQPLFQIPGSTPPLLDLAPGCAFRTRCYRATEGCEATPQLQIVGKHHQVSCWHHGVEGPAAVGDAIVAQAMAQPDLESVDPGIKLSQADFAAAQAPLISLRGLERHYQLPGSLWARAGAWVGRPGASRTLQAVAGVDLDVAQGEVIGIVGESGCGKSTLGRMLTGMLTPTAGRILYKGQTAAAMSAASRHQQHLAIQMIFQDPFSSLNPRMRVMDIVGEAPVAHGMVRSSDQEDYVVGLMHKVGLDPAWRFRYPHQFSGGQRQRIGVARALALRPSVLVCDEAVAALDVSIQAQVLNLFMQLQAEFGLTYFFISHNLGVVSHISDRVAIMYLGRIVEVADTDTIFTRAQHPYTQALIKELPVLRTGQRQFATIKGEQPSPLAPPPGCPFHPRCEHAMAKCRTDRPVLQTAGPDAGHLSACHLNTTTLSAARPASLIQPQVLTPDC